MGERTGETNAAPMPLAPMHSSGGARSSSTYGDGDAEGTCRPRGPAQPDEMSSPASRLPPRHYGRYFILLCTCTQGVDEVMTWNAKVTLCNLKPVKMSVATFAYKAPNNTDTLHIKHYIIRKLCTYSVLCSAIYANSLLFRSM